MPLYEYECEACGHRFERIQKFSDPPAEVCPHCGKKKLHKLVSSPAIQFKGSGFYINDYARKGTGAGADSSKDGESSKGSESSKDGESSRGSDSSKDSDSSKASSATEKPAKNDGKSGDKSAAAAQKGKSAPATTTSSSSAKDSSGSSKN
jgi:putative FmdB family regulatory protein